MPISPLTRKKFKRFVAIKRGYYAFVLLVAMILASLGAELLVSNRALIVSYQGHWYFPTYGDIIPGKAFGLDYDYETDYRDLSDRFRSQPSGNWVLLPPVPYSPFENDLRPDMLPPEPPSFERRHYLGTDTSGRDVLARSGIRVPHRHFVCPGPFGDDLCGRYQYRVRHGLFRRTGSISSCSASSKSGRPCRFYT
jgi:microcin C transport system permease protein